jgi:protein-export membrane protein SecD
MLQFRIWQIVLILGVIAVAAVFAAPNLLTEKRREALPEFVPSTHVNLGLDLKGGSYLLLGVDTRKVIQDRMNNTRQEVLRALRPSGGRERIAIADQPHVDIDKGTITVRLRDPQQLQAAEKRIRDAVIGATFINQIPFYEVTAADQRITVQMTEAASDRYKQEALAQSIEVVRRRIDSGGTKEVSIAPQGAERIVIQAPGDNDPEALKAIVARTGQLSFHRVDMTADPVEAANGQIPPSRIYVPFAPDAGEGAGGLVLFEDPEITGDMVNSASAGLNTDGGGFQINFAFDNAGAIRFGDFTREHVGELFAIVLDNTIISAPRIQTPITGGSGRITGNFGSDEANRVATLIRSGALPAPLSTKDQRSVGPELGADSVRAGAISLVISFVLVILFMIVTYGRFGVYANIALIGNVILMAGFLSMINATLTLPGIAGIVLTIGMAVDANVLIYERIREELAAGKTPIKATELGFEKALSAIADSQITTFLAAAIMLVLGAGPVRGFAVTLAVGVVTSVFTAIYVTKLLVGSYLLKKRPAALVL